MIHILSNFGNELSALFGAFITFVAKSIYDKRTKKIDNKNSELDRIMLLQELLRQSKSIFISQVTLRNQLYDSLIKRFSDLEGNYSKFFFNHFGGLNQLEREWFDLIRATTQNSLKTVNFKMSDWCYENYNLNLLKENTRENIEFKKDLVDLKDHLTLWKDKFLIFESNPKYCLVYLGDGADYRQEFPKHIEISIKSYL